jgi:hypothetical protein
LALTARQGVGAPLLQVADAQQLDHAVQRDAALRRGDAAQAVADVAAHVQVIEQRGLLDHVADRPPVHRHEPARGVVLPHLVADGDAAGRALEPGQRAQQRGLAAARRPEQCADTARRQGQIDVEREAVARQAQRQLDHGGGARGALGCVRRGRLTTCSVTSTSIANTTMPAASRCACMNSLASTWS